jgi:hypothetical protein
MAETVDDKRKLLILGAVGLLFAIAFALVLNGNETARYKSDIFLRWYASEKLLSQGRNLYDMRNATEVATYAYPSPWQTNYYYPAHMLLFTAPLALLPYRTAHLVWTVATQLFYLIGLWLVAREVGWPGSVAKFTIFMVAAVLFIPYFQHTIWGQFNTIGLLSLALCYVALRRGRYALAGVWAIGLTFKPHTTLLTLAFLLFWALFERRRWPFYLGFFGAGLALAGMAEGLQPGWIPDFLSSLGGYDPTPSILDLIWNPYQVTAVVLTLGAVALFAWRRSSAPGSPAFDGCLAVSLAAWPLVVPIIGMLHATLFPLAALLLLPHLKEERAGLYPLALCGLLLIYLLGIAGFAWGLASPERYGQHIAWSELAYKSAAPLLLLLFSIPLQLERQVQAQTA